MMERQECGNYGCNNLIDEMDQFKVGIPRKYCSIKCKKHVKYLRSKLRSLNEKIKDLTNQRNSLQRELPDA